MEPIDEFMFNVENVVKNGIHKPRVYWPVLDARHVSLLRAKSVFKNIWNFIIFRIRNTKKYPDLRGVGGKYRSLPLSYDFYLIDYNLLIEYQGEFHDHTASIQTDEAYEIQVKHDELKRNYAMEHNINLLEIWYYDFDNIERILEDHLKNPVTTTVA